MKAIAHIPNLLMTNQNNSSILSVKIVQYYVKQDNDENVAQKPIKPDINNLEVSSFRERCLHGPKERSKDKERSDCSHESV